MIIVNNFKRAANAAEAFAQLKDDAKKGIRGVNPEIADKKHFWILGPEDGIAFSETEFDEALRLINTQIIHNPPSYISGEYLGCVAVWHYEDGSSLYLFFGWV